jgi:hypothetical protein
MGGPVKEMAHVTNVTKPCPICKGVNYLEGDAWANARSYSSSPASNRVKCWNCVDGQVPTNHAYKIIRKAAEYPAVDTFTVIDVGSCDSLSHHESEAKARAAVRRYERADARQGGGQIPRS